MRAHLLCGSKRRRCRRSSRHCVHPSLRLPLALLPRRRALAARSDPGRAGGGTEACSAGGTGSGAGGLQRGPEQRNLCGVLVAQ